MIGAELTPFPIPLPIWIHAFARNDGVGAGILKNYAAWMVGLRKIGIVCGTTFSCWGWRF